MLTICIVLYNKKLENSESYNSLLNIIDEFDLKIVVYNNGPAPVDAISREGRVVINNVLINGSLSKIYNNFLSNYDAEKYLFLDDDTSVSRDYLQEIICVKNEVIIPRIVCNGKLEYPVVKKGNVQSITSGLIISRRFKEKLFLSKSKVFDERFDLYGIDTYFFERINKLKLQVYISENCLNHELSHIVSGSNQFRSKEVLLANCAALFAYVGLKNFLRVAMGMLGAILSFNFSLLFSCIFSCLLSRVIRLWKV